MSAEGNQNDNNDVPPEPEDNTVPPEPNNNSVPPPPEDNNNSESNTSSVPSEPPEEGESNAETTANTESSSESTNTPANALASGVEIAKGAEQEAEAAEEEEEDEEESPFYLGRRLQIVYTKHTALSQVTVSTTGRIYHISNAMIRLMPDGVSDRLYDFPLVDDDFDPDLGVKKLRFYGEPPRLPFVTLQGFRSGQVLIAFDEKGDPLDSFVVEEINETDDKLIVKSETSGDTITIDSDFQGIPLDLPFSVLRVKPQIEEKKAEEEAIEGEAEGLEEAEEELIEFELPQVAEFVELSKAEQVFPEITQKSSFLADLTNLFDAVSQKNPAVMKQLRTHVEMFSALKNSVIRRNPDGSVVGESQVSLLTLQDILSNRTVPLVKPVLESQRVLVGEYALQDETVAGEDQVITKRLDDLTEDSKNYIEQQGDIVAAQPGFGLPRWFQALQGYFDHYPMGDKYTREGYAFETDTEFFRHAHPGDGTIKGLPKGNPDETKKGGFNLEKNPVEQYIGPVKSSYRRGHGPTYRALEKGGIELSILPDRAPVKGYVIFPYRSVLTGVIGAIRTGSLWENIQRSMSRESTMNLVLEMFEGVSLEDLDAQKIIYLDASTATAVQIQFTDYLQLLVKTLVLRGPGDLHTVKADLGIQESELNVEQADIVQGRVMEVLESIRTLIRQLRTDVAPVVAEAHPLQESEFMTLLQQSVAQHPKLNELLDAMRERTPGYKNIDIAAMGFLMVYAQDYLLAAIGGDPRAIKREFVRYQRDFLLRRDAELQKAINLKLEAGHAPVRNPCEHVNALTLCRKAPTANERIALLAKLLKKFTGGREENWIQCIVCEQHLVCHHETLQIKQFLHPREKDAIQKEIVLGYAGGTFGRHHICRNCGLPIAEMEFDTSMEYDDEGRPMSGREVMVDLDAIEEEQLAYILGPRISAVTGITFETPAKQRIYGIARVLVDRVYVSFSEPTYVKLVNRAEGYLKQLVPTIEAYKKQTAASADRKHLPYATYKSVTEISTIAALVFLELQTKFPDYLVGAIVLGCKPGFGGYPLIADADPLSTEQSVGIHYMTCAMTDIHRGTDEPWASGFQMWKVQKTRKETILKQLVTRLKWIIEHDAAIQQELQDKRDYLNKVYGEGAGTGKSAERLPAGFLPRMETPTEAAENAAKAPTEVGARGTLGEIQQADTWIRAANKFAKETAVVIQGSPYAETTCCSSQLTAPGGFWTDHTMPELPPFYTLKKYYKRQSILYPLYFTRPLQQALGEPKLEEAYQVYLQVCWKGPRIGLTHEFGYDHKCDWCELQIPIEYIYPDVFEDNPSWGKAKRKQEAEKQQLYEQKLHSDLITSLTAQGVPIADPLAFQALLDAAHKRTEFRQYQSPDVMPTTQLVEKLEAIDPAPLPSWKALLESTLTNLKALDPTASGPEIANAMTLRQGLTDGFALLKRDLGNADANRLIEIAKLPPAELIEVIRSYFLVPFERVSDTNQFQKLVLPYQYKKGKRSLLHERHVEILESMLAVHTSYVKIYKERFEESGLANLKLAYAAEQFRNGLAFAEELRASRLQLTDRMPLQQITMLLQEILRVILLGPLSLLLDETFFPELEDDAEVPSDDPVTTKADLREFIQNLLALYNSEKITYDSAIVRTKIAKSKEEEKQRFIQSMDRMTDEERQMEVIKKKLGLGRWAVGGSKLTFQYDADYWEQQRQERMETYGAAVGVEGLPLPQGGEAREDVGQGYDLDYNIDE